MNQYSIRGCKSFETTSGPRFAHLFTASNQPSSLSIDPLSSHKTLIPTLRPKTATSAPSHQEYKTTSPLHAPTPLPKSHGYRKKKKPNSPLPHHPSNKTPNKTPQHQHTQPPKRKPALRQRFSPPPNPPHPLPQPVVRPRPILPRPRVQRHPLLEARPREDLPEAQGPLDGRDAGEVDCRARVGALGADGGGRGFGGDGWGVGGCCARGEEGVCVWVFCGARGERWWGGGC